MDLPLLDPRNDLVFKLQFARSLPLLTDLINAVRREEPPIEVVRVLNPQIDPEDLEGKFIVLDILAKDKKEHFFNIEMQMSRREQWSARSVYYLAKTMAGQLKAGQGYSQLKPVIGIHLLAYELFKDQAQACWRFELRDQANPRIKLGNELELNIIELPKAARLAATQPAAEAMGTALMAWLMYFEHSQEEDIMNQIAHPGVVEAMANLRDLSADEETRRRAERRELALIAERTELDAAREVGKLEGKLEGKIEGRDEGIAIGMANALNQLIQRGIPEAQARVMLGM